MGIITRFKEKNLLIFKPFKIGNKEYNGNSKKIEREAARVDTKKLKEKGVYLEQGGYMPNAPIPTAPPFRQNMRMMGHGGQTSVTNDKAGAGDISTVHSHSGYKAGE